MSRSLKKAPYVEAKLFDRICEMNAKNEKKVLKTWSVTSSVSLHLPERSRATQAPRHPTTVNNSQI